MKTIAFLLTLATLAVAGVGHAHSQLYRSEPAENGRVKQKPGQVLLEFGEAIESKFSTFKVYRLETAEAPNDPKALHPQAMLLMNQVLQTRGDEDKRVDSGVMVAGNTVRLVTINLKANLEPGAYVVMWQVLSVDTHVLKDFLVFVYQP